MLGTSVTPTVSSQETSNDLGKQPCIQMLGLQLRVGRDGLSWLGVAFVSSVWALLSCS